MRAAPAVTVRCTGGLGWRVLRTALPALAAGVLASWLLLQGGMTALPAIAVATAVALPAWQRTRPRVVMLVWDGQQWSADGVAGSLAVMIDIGPALLLRLRPQHGALHWAAVTAAEAGAAWHALRAAVYSRPSEPSARVRSPERTAD